MKDCWVDGLKMGHFRVPSLPVGSGTAKRNHQISHLLAVCHQRALGGTRRA